MDLSQFKNLERWWKSIDDRKAVQKGTSVPTESKLVNAKFAETVKGDEEMKKKEEMLKEALVKAKEQFNYKFSAP